MMWHLHGLFVISLHGPFMMTFAIAWTIRDVIERTLHDEISMDSS
jgi:hypothetical protein